MQYTSKCASREERGAKCLLTSVIQTDGILEASIEICCAFNHSATASYTVVGRLHGDVFPSE